MQHLPSSVIEAVNEVTELFSPVNEYRFPRWVFRRVVRWRFDVSLRRLVESDGGRLDPVPPPPGGVEIEPAPGAGEGAPIPRLSALPKPK